MTAGTPTRRDLLASTAGLGVVGLAGCLGGDGEENGAENGEADGEADGEEDGEENGGEIEETTLHLTVPPSGTINHDSGQAMQRALRQESEAVDLNISEVGGNPDSIQTYDDGENDGYVTDNFAVVSAIEEMEPFDENPVDNVAYQAFSHTFLHWYWMGVEGSGLESTDDLVEEDVNVWPLPPAWGARRFQELVHENAGMWESLSGKTVQLETSDVPGAIEEGRIDALIGYGAGYTSLAGWATEVDARADVYMLETGDDLIEGVEETQGTAIEEIEPYGWEQDVGTDSVTSWTLPSQFCFGSEVPDEVVYEICRVSYEHNDVVREALEAYVDHNSDPETMTSGLMDNDPPVHPGAADFLEEQGVWRDSLTRG